MKDNELFKQAYKDNTRYINKLFFNSGVIFQKGEDEKIIIIPRDEREVKSIEYNNGLRAYFHRGIEELYLEKGENGNITTYADTGRELDKKVNTQSQIRPQNVSVQGGPLPVPGYSSQVVDPNNVCDVIDPLDGGTEGVCVPVVAVGGLKTALDPSKLSTIVTAACASYTTLCNGFDKMVETALKINFTNNCSKIK